MVIYRELTKNPIKHFRYYRRKMQNKLRVMYTRKKIQWDGYYYVALTNEEYEELLESLIRKAGRGNIIPLIIRRYLRF